MVVINGAIYIIESDYSWTAEANYLYSTGTGSSYALGALHSLTGNKRPTASQARSICTKALTVASKFDPYTGSPFQTFIQEAPHRKTADKDS